MFCLNVNNLYVTNTNNYVEYLLAWLPDRWMDGWTDGWMDGWMNGLIDWIIHSFIHWIIHSSIHSLNYSFIHLFYSLIRSNKRKKHCTTEYDYWHEHEHVNALSSSTLWATKILSEVFIFYFNSYFLSSIWICSSFSGNHHK